MKIVRVSNSFTNTSHIQKPSVKKGRSWQQWTIKIAKTGFIATLAIGAGIIASQSSPFAPAETTLSCPLPTQPLQLLCPLTPLYSVNQTDLDALGWSIPLLREPSMPEPRTIDCKQAQKWVQKHPTRREKALALGFIESLQYIPQRQFEEALRCTTGDVNKQIQNADFVLMTMEGKSNHWVASLSLKYWDHLPIETAWNVERGPIDHPHLADFAKKVKHFVFPDDAIYSGAQMSNHVLELYQALHKYLPEDQFTIHIAVPYIRDSSEFLNMLIHQGVPLSVVRIAKHERLPSLKEKLSPTLQKDLSLLHRGREKKPSVFFDHKLPDHVSTFESLLEGCISDRIYTVSERLFNWIKYKLTGDRCPEEGHLCPGWVYTRENLCRYGRIPYLSDRDPPYKRG